MNIVLLNLSFTDQLIEEHLGLKKRTAPEKEPNYLPRDSTMFRKFVGKTYLSKDREDPYTHFFLKEGAKKEKIEKLVDEEKELQREIDMEPDITKVEEG